MKTVVNAGYGRSATLSRYERKMCWADAVGLARRHEQGAIAFMARELAAWHVVASPDQARQLLSDLGLDKILPAEACAALVGLLTKQAQKSCKPGAIGNTGRVDTLQRPAQVSQSSPTGQAQGFIQQESARLEREKYQFTPEQRAKTDKFNALRAQENAKHLAKAGEVEAEMAKVYADPKLKPKDKLKKLRKLGEKRAKILKKIKPPIVLEKVTAEVDAIVNDKGLDDKEKKKRIEQLRKHYGLAKNGSVPFSGPGKEQLVNMHDMFTGRLGHLYAKSSQRVKAHGKAQQAALKTQLKGVEQTYGAKSPQALALKAEIDQVDKLHKTEAKRLKSTSAFLHNMYRPIGFWEKVGRFFKKIGKWLVKIIDFVMPIIQAVIPGIGQIAGAIWGGVKAVGNLVTGNWKGALTAVLGAIPAAGGLIAKAVGGVAGTVINLVGKGVKYVKSGVKAVTSLVKGDVAGALSGAAGIAGTAGASEVASVLCKTAKGVGAVQKLAKGDVAGALGQVGDALGDTLPSGVSDGLRHAGTAVDTVQKLSSGDITGALSSAGRGLEGVVPIELHQVITSVQGLGKQNPELGPIVETLQMLLQQTRTAAVDARGRRALSRLAGEIEQAIRTSDHDSLRRIAAGDAKEDAVRERLEEDLKTQLSFAMLAMARG